MKKIVRLTESDLHRIVKESVAKILNEIGDTEKGQDALGQVHGRAIARAAKLGDKGVVSRKLRNTARDAADKAYSEAEKNNLFAGIGSSFDNGIDKGYHKAKTNESRINRAVKESVKRALRENTKYSEEIMDKIADAYEDSIKWSHSIYGNGNWKATFINELAWIIVDNNLTVEDMANYGNVLKVIDANSLQQEVDNCIRANRLEQMDDKRREHEAWAEEQMSNMGFGFEGD
jgi:hypothetical protein